MIFSDVDMVVHNTISDHGIIMLVSIGVKGPGREVRRVFDLVLITSNVVPSCNNAGGHVIESPCWHGSVQYSNGQVGAPVAGSTVEANVTRHAHVHSCERRSHARVVGAPITHHESLEAELILQQVVESVAVLAAIAVVDPV
jgi:hypothetical protein